MTRKVFFTLILLLTTVLLGVGQTKKISGKANKNMPEDTAHKNDVFSWVLDDFNDSSRVTMDTVFYTRHLFNPNNGNIYLSAYGTPLLFNDFTKRDGADFLFNRSYTPYFREPSTAEFYRTTTPFTYLNFDTGGGDDAESDLEVFHTQNVNELWNVGIDAKILSSQKFYERETSLKSHHITLFSSYEDTTYQLFTSFISNKASHKHIGGIDDVKEIQTAGFLEDATSTIKSKHVDIKQKYYLGSSAIKKNDKSSIRDTSGGTHDSLKVDTLAKNIQLSKNDVKSDYSFIEKPGFIRKGLGIYHNFTFSVNDYKYADKEVSSDFYKPYPVYIDSTQTKDKARQQTLSNNISLFYKSDHFDINIGLEHNYNIYSYIFPFEPEDTVINKYDVSNKAYNNLRFTGNVQLEWKGNFSFSGSVESWFFGYQKGDLNLGANIRKDFNHSYLLARGRYFLKEPNFFLNQYHSNYFKWNNSFDKKNKLSINLEYSNRKHDLRIALKPRIIKNYIYIDTASVPKQENKWIDYLSVSVEKDFHFWKFHLKNNFQYQYSNYDNILRIPDFYVHQSLAFRHTFKFKVTGGQLKSQLGIGYYYFSGYKANAFMPALSLFYQQDQTMIGGRPLVNVFANFKLKRTSFYIKAFHANSFMDNKNYYSAPNYPISDLMLKFGILWTFYN